MSLPLVSVILTVYEREQYLPTALESALAQTFCDYEIIVTDDSNRRSIRRICESFECAERLRYRANPKRLGAPLNIRAAIHETKGRYISILNDDDFWEPAFLDKLVAQLEAKSDRILSFSDHWIVRETGAVDENATEANSLLYGRKGLSSGEVRDPVSLVLLKNGVPLAMASVFRKDVLAPSLLTKEVGGSYDFWIACAMAVTGKAFYYVPDRLSYYRVHGRSETARKSADKNLTTIFISEQLLERKWFPSMQKLLKHRLAEAFYRNGRDLLWFGQAVSARRMFRKAMRLTWHQKSAVAFALSFAPRCIRYRSGLSQ